MLWTTALLLNCYFEALLRLAPMRFCGISAEAFWAAAEAGSAHRSPGLAAGDRSNIAAALHAVRSAGAMPLPRQRAWARPSCPRAPSPSLARGDGRPSFACAVAMTRFRLLWPARRQALGSRRRGERGVALTPAISFASRAARAVTAVARWRRRPSPRSIARRRAGRAKAPAPDARRAATARLREDGASAAGG